MEGVTPKTIKPIFYSLEFTDGVSLKCNHNNVENHIDDPFPDVLPKNKLTCEE